MEGTHVSTFGYFGYEVCQLENPCSITVGEDSLEQQWQGTRFLIISTSLLPRYCTIVLFWLAYSDVIRIVFNMCEIKIFLSVSHFVKIGEEHFFTDNDQAQKSLSFVSFYVRDLKIPTILARLYVNNLLDISSVQ